MTTNPRHIFRKASGGVTTPSAILPFLFLSCLFLSCQSRYTVTVTETVINAGIFGNGVEWDPYDEALSWGAGIPDEDWAKLRERMDCMKPGYVRCMINSPYLYFDGGKFDPQRNSRNIIELLSWCERNDVSVVYGEFNPPSPELKGSDEWVRMSVAYLNWLVGENGFSCIRHFVIFNEPDGNWAYTDGDFDFWADMYRKFEKEMRRYPALSTVTLAGPDAVLNYSNPASEFDSYGWVEETAASLDSITGLYDIHCYPGQHYVRSGGFGRDVARVRSIVPEGRKFIFGEGGYKYYNAEDAALLEECRRRVEGHPFTEGSDCNMLVTDFFYALDMPLFAMEAMNNGASGVAAWMLDDSMHSNGDSGRPEDVKIWGMWNILGKEVFGDESLEELRPWFFTWSLICRCFPSSCDILEVKSDLPEGVFACASKTVDGRRSVVFVNIGDTACDISLNLPVNICESQKGLESRDSQASPANAASLHICTFTAVSSTQGRLDIRTALPSRNGTVSLSIPPESFTAVSSSAEVFTGLSQVR